MKIRNRNTGEIILEVEPIRGADLSSADISFANLSFANLRYADLSFANLRSANLVYADLSFANLRGANLRGADLGEANLSGANISSTIGIDPAETNAGKQNRDLFPFCVDGEWMLSLGCFTGNENKCILAIREKYGEGSEYERKVMSAFQKARNGRAKLL
jgi:hypothetical protein